jgi:endonuclease YncB( thermonuclease family)
LEVLDGDTVRVNVDLGLDIVASRRKIRLNRINAAEKGTEAGERAKQELVKLMSGKSCELVTMKDKTEKYGRYLGEFFLPGIGNVSDWLCQQGLATYWDGTGKRPVP